MTEEGWCKITAVKGRVVYNSRGSKTVEVDITANDKFVGRVCAPSGASVGSYEATSFPKGGPEESIKILDKNANKFIGLNPSDIRGIQEILKKIDKSTKYNKIGGNLVFAITIAATEAAAKATGQPLYKILAEILSHMEYLHTSEYRFPLPLGNILGGGVHAGPGTPDIQEILVCATGANTIEDAVKTNLDVHSELRSVLEGVDSEFTNGRGDEGGWAPKLGNEKALEVSAKACERLGFTLGREVSLGVDFASSTQWDKTKQKYVYDRAGFENDPGEQIDYTAQLIKKYKLVYAEDAVHEESFEGMAKLTDMCPRTMITGDDLTVTNTYILEDAIRKKSCNAAILKVNQAGGLYDALRFATKATKNDISLITSHRSGESNDAHISHIALATGSIMLKAGIVGGERVAKINELLRISNDLGEGSYQMAKIPHLA